LLGSAQFGSTVVIADLEAGIGTLTRLDSQTIDVVVVVVEPTPRSIEVATRALELAAGRGKGRVVIVANRVLDSADESRLRLAFPGHDLVLVPLDQAIADADRKGLSPLDTAPDSPGVIALLGVADRLGLGL
jgi:CO dehydrogenase maturation factor